MTLEEYKEKKKAIELEHKKALSALAVQYAESNNPYKVGDIIKDHIGQGRILSWVTTFDFNSNIPVLVYRCENLTAKGEIKKREPIRDIFQKNIKQ